MTWKISDNQADLMTLKSDVRNEVFKIKDQEVIVAFRQDKGEMDFYFKI